MAESEYDSEVEFNLNKNSEVPAAEEDIEHQPCDDTIIIDGIQEALEGSDEHGEYLQRDSGAKRPSQSGTVAMRHESSQSRGYLRANREMPNSKNEHHERNRRSSPSPARNNPLPIPSAHQQRPADVTRDLSIPWRYRSPTRSSGYHDVADDSYRRDRNQNSSVSPKRYRSPSRYYRQHMHPDHQYPDDLTAMRPLLSRPTAQHHLQIKPETFDGSDDWDQYISHFQNCAELGRWSDADKTLTLASCLKGQARSYYLGLTLPDRSSYRGLVQKLTERFGSTRQQNRYLTKFETRSRRPGEDIAALGDDLRLIAQRAYPNLGPDAQETLALHQLYKIIPIEMKCRCIDRDCTTIATAVQIIERYEALLGDNTDRKRTTIRAIDSQFNRKRPDSGRDNIHMDDPLHQVMDRLAKLENYPDTRNAGYRTQQNKPMGGRGMTRPIRRRCYACDSEDHFMRECPLYQKFMAETRRAATNNGKLHSALLLGQGLADEGEWPDEQ